MDKIAHFTVSMVSRQTFCGVKVINMAYKPGEAVYHKKHESPASVEARGEVPCVKCVERAPLLDLVEAL